ncbi:MAG: acetate--CoA ligase family protein [Candidatus Micrarchaeia archaeon]
MDKLDLKKAIEPKTIAVVGASRNPSKVGNAVLKNLLMGGYNGRIYAVNPNAEKILGVNCYKSVLDIKGDVECAIIAVPAPYVNQVLRECGKKGVGGAVVLSGGFKEVGEKELEEEFVRVCKKYNIAAIGPNCLGIINMQKHIDSTFLPTYKMKRSQVGKISFITQSGAVGSTILDLVAESNIGVSKFISYGNATVIDESDLLEYLRDDPDTSVIVVYIEGVKDGRKFYEVLKSTTAIKPVVVLKAGKGRLASEAAKSHTGALAGDYKVFSSMLKQAGAVEAENLDELFNLLKVFLQPLPRGDRIMVITNGGGDGVLAMDAIEKNGLRPAQLSKKTIRKFKRMFPRHVVVGNPLDLTGDADSERYRKVLTEIIKEEGVDAIVVITLFQTVGLGPEVIRVVMEADNMTDKTIVSVATGGEYTRMLLKIVESSGLPTYGSPSSAISAIAKSLWYQQYLRRISESHA